MWYTEEMTSDEHVYHRRLPSGGYVAITAEQVQPLFAPAKVRGHVVVERRAKRRDGSHAAPIAAFAERDDVAQVLAALVPIAESDEILTATLARGATVPIIERRSHHP